MEPMAKWMLPPEASEWIEKNLRKDSIILEFGSGHGSIRLAKKYTVYSIEHDQEWLDVAPVNYIYAPIVNNPISESKGEFGWYDADAIRESLPKRVDLIIIDGPPGKPIGRSGILAHTDILHPKATILVDDYNRDVEKEIARVLHEKRGGKLEVHVSSLKTWNGLDRKFCIIYPPNLISRLLNRLRRLF